MNREASCRKTNASEEKQEAEEGNSETLNTDAEFDRCDYP